MYSNLPDMTEEEAAELLWRLCRTHVICTQEAFKECMTHVLPKLGTRPLTVEVFATAIQRSCTQGTVKEITSIASQFINTKHAEYVADVVDFIQNLGLSPPAVEEFFELFKRLQKGPVPLVTAASALDVSRAHFTEALAATSGSHPVYVNLATRDVHLQDVIGTLVQEAELRSALTAKFRASPRSSV